VRESWEKERAQQLTTSLRLADCELDGRDMWLERAAQQLTSLRLADCELDGRDIGAIRNSLLIHIIL